MARAPAKPMKTLVLHVDPALYDWLHAKADELGVTKTALVAALIAQAKKEDKR